MNSLRYLIAVLLVTVMFCETTLAGLGSNKAQYVGGTTTALSQGVEGSMSTDDATVLKFTSSKQNWQTPYEKITALSYGQHAGRRVGATVALGVTTLGIGALPVLFSKKRRHYLTIEYKDDQGKDQAAIFEIGKDAIRTTLKSLEVRSDKKIEYEDEEARKAGNK